MKKPKTSNPMTRSRVTPDVLAIDELRLDKEWVGQPQLALNWNEKLAEARHVHDLAKADLDTLAARLGASIRLKPERYQIEKITESAITMAVQLDLEYIAQQRRVIDARHEVELVQAVVTAIEHRKRALTKLVDLHLSNYFSEPGRTKAGDLSGNAKRIRSRENTRRALSENEVGDED
jgi:hypothetical protein